MSESEPTRQARGLAPTVMGILSDGEWHDSSEIKARILGEGVRTGTLLVARCLDIMHYDLKEIERARVYDAEGLLVGFRYRLRRAGE